MSGTSDWRYRRQMHGLDRRYRFLLVSNNFFDAVHWAEMQLNMSVGFYERDREIMVRLPGGRNILFDVVSHRNALRGLRDCRIIIGTNWLNSELDHAMWETQHRTFIGKEIEQDPEFLCLAWTQEWLWPRLADYEPVRYDYVPYPLRD